MSFTANNTGGAGWLGDQSAAIGLVADGVYDGIGRNGISLVAWVKCTQAQWQAIDGESIIGLWNSTTVAGGGYEIQRREPTPSPDGEVGATTWDDTSNNNSAQYGWSGTQHNDIWRCVAAVFASDTDRQIYINGAAETASHVGQRDFVGVRYWAIAQRSTTFNAFNGLVAECAFFNRALTAHEIDSLTLANGVGLVPWAVAPYACVGYYPLRYPRERLLDESPLGMGPAMTRADGSGSWSNDHPKIVTPRQYSQALRRQSVRNARIMKPKTYGVTLPRVATVRRRSVRMGAL